MSTLTTPLADPRVWNRDVELTPEELGRRKYENWLETEAGVEVVNGEIVEKAMSWDGDEVGLTIGSLLRIAGKRDDGWRVFNSGLGYKVYADDPTKHRKPDVSAIRRTRLVGVAVSGYMLIPADLAVEVISPKESTDESIEKAEEYLAHDFKLVWLVFTKIRKVYVFSAGSKDVRRLGPDDTIDGGDVLPGFACRVGEFFEN